MGVFCFNHAIVVVNSCTTIGAKQCDPIKQAPQSTSKITVEQQADIENLRHLMFVRSEQSFIQGFDDTDIDCMI